MSTYNRLTYRLLLVAVGIFLTVSLWAQADASPRDFRRYMTSLKQQTERQNLLSNYPRVEALLTEADSLMTARRALGLAVEGKTEADFLKLRGDYYYWLALGAGETDAAHKADSCYTACLITYRTRFLPMPDTVVLLNQLGQLYYTQQDYTKALAYLQSAAESRTPYTSPRERQNARMGVAMCQVRLGDDVSRFILPAKSKAGRGGMTSKFNTALAVAQAGIRVIIANGNRDAILPALIENPAQTVHTEFLPLTVDQ